jgi:hypothetical protein
MRHFEGRQVTYFEAVDAESSPGRAPVTRWIQKSFHLCAAVRDGCTSSMDTGPSSSIGSNSVMVGDASGVGKSVAAITA